MKILLVSITMGALTEELGICMIASVLKRDFEVDVVSYSVNSIDENAYKEMQTFEPDAIGINIYEATRKRVYEVCRILVEDSQNVMKFFNQHNINQHFGFINFNPYSTFDTLRENAQFLTENQHLSFGNVFNYATALMLFETTALYEKVRRDELLLDDYSGLFKYKFCDPKIQVLAEFMVLTFSDIQRSFGNIVMHDLADKYIDVLSILQKELSASDHYKDLLDLIAETKEKAKSDIIKHFHFHEFFNELIALSENSWNADKALKIVNSAYDKKTWLRAIEKIKKDRMLLYKQILMTDSFSRKLLSSLT